MPALRVDLYGSRNSIKDKCFDMNPNQKGAKMSFSGTRALLLWCRQQTEGYNDVNVYNMTSSWRDGLGFCAIIHRFRPDLIDFERLSKENIFENNELAFSIGERYLGIPVVLDASDMLESSIPDKLSVITYVSQLYEYFKNKTPANQGFSTKMNTLPKSRAVSTGPKGSKRTSPSQQIYTLSGHAKRMATALRNVFRSDTKDDPSKNKEIAGAKHMAVDPLRTSADISKYCDEMLNTQIRKVPFLGTVCFICHHKVFMVERLIVERKLFHRSCFRCNKCSAYLRLGTYHYSPETEMFCCLFDCTFSGGHKEHPIKFRFEPMSSTQLNPSSGSPLSCRPSNLSNRSSNKSEQNSKSSLQRQFSVVKRNAITIRSLPQKLNEGKPALGKSPKLTMSSCKLGSNVQNNGEDGKKLLSDHRTCDSWETKRQVGEVLNGMQCTSTLSHPHVKMTSLEGPMDRENVQVNVNFDITNETPVTVNFSTAESRNRQSEDFKEKPFVLKKKEGNKTKVKLAFSFKEELLKRATEMSTNEAKAIVAENKHNTASSKDDQVDKRTMVSGEENKNNSFPCKEYQVDNLNVEKESLRETESASDNVSQGMDLETDAPEFKNGNLLDEVEPPIPAKSVQKLREKFLNINDMIELKHKNNLARKQTEMQREFRSISAWKKQLESSYLQARKFPQYSNYNDKPKQEVSGSGSGRSVKELRKRYMGNSGDHGKSIEEKPSPVHLRTVSDPVRNGQDSSDDLNVVATHPRSYSTEKDYDVTDSKKTKAEDNFSSLLPMNNIVDKETQQNENVKEMITVICVGGNSDAHESSDSSSQLVSFANFGRMSQETRIHTVIQSNGVTTSSTIPSFEIHPSSPELPRSNPPSPCGANLQIYGSKRHAASHDSGIDMLSSMQGACLDSVPGIDNIAQTSKLLTKEESPDIVSPLTDVCGISTRERLSSETGSDLQGSDCPMSPTSDYSPEVSWSRPLSVNSITSCTDSSSSCSTPRMSVIIAQEASTTKINSRFFTVETMDPSDFDTDRTMEDHQCVMEIEGEFQFGREKSRTSRAEREAIFSLHRDAKTSSCNSCDLIKEEEITLSPEQIESELKTLENVHTDLEKRGVDIEQCLRESMDSERPYNCNEDELLQEWLTLVQDRNIILRRESELIYLLQSHNYEERYRTVEGELRKLVAMRDEVKSSDDVKRERELLSELLELVQKRSFIVDSLEEDRVRELQEDEKVEQAMTED